ncbi:hypothetical protein GCM10010911_20430 [Paenibacillus nasutitermitis]|uniref:Uncharacterized protein n=1 Tax=Paenibacillus nasutitermitis TaxID=1652958 RepID=A0A916YVE7_9BACL|nr:hypothetical protein GCM10010911_20430 [Paenibacillus nasutitermitis]
MAKLMWPGTTKPKSNIVIQFPDNPVYNPASNPDNNAIKR